MVCVFLIECCSTFESCCTFRLRFVALESHPVHPRLAIKSADKSLIWMSHSNMRSQCIKCAGIFSTDTAGKLARLQIVAGLSRSQGLQSSVSICLDSQTFLPSKSYELVQSLWYYLFISVHFSYFWLHCIRVCWARSVHLMRCK